MRETIFPKDFLMGSAGAGAQIEGGDKNSNWYHWSLKGRIANGESSLTGAGHYKMYEKDIEIMKALNQEVYRMSIEWSRIEPLQGKWDEEEIQHYRDELTLLNKEGIKPLVTLHHFSHPQWIEDAGGWLKKTTVDCFLRFVEKIVDELGDLIQEYCTINEPNVFLQSAYMEGFFPPGKNGSTGSYFKGAKNMIRAHIKAYEIIHSKSREKGYRDIKVGFAHHIACLECSKDSRVLRMSRNILDYSFHKMFLDGMILGKMPFKRKKESEGKIYADFIGVNYYSRHMIHPSFNPGMFFGKVEVDSSIGKERLNDLGWEIYPEGIYKVCWDAFKEYKLPIYITENGIADKDDGKRGRFILDHLRWVGKLIQDGVPVKRYYHWATTDNFEWHEGYSPRFGLVEVDYNTFERRIRNSGRMYGEICSKKKITEEMIKTMGGVVWEN